MERYAAVLNYAIPFFMSLLLIEWLVSYLRGKKIINGMDTLSSLSSGVTNAIKDVLGLTFIIVSYGWFVEKIALLEVESTWLVYGLAFVGLDFAGYWNHRLQHKVNYFWNVHIIHHSSEEFNLACALRQSISSLFSTLTFFLIPTALLGVPQEVVAVVAPLHLFAQYWYHTRLIGKMGFLENILVTPSHHRVHHAINKEYLDKNLSQIFILWDKLFGTFQEELAHVPPVYGVKKPVRTWNPILINFMHLWQLVKDAWRTRSVWDKLRIWFMPTGWRPRDVKFKYPIELLEDGADYDKYRPQLSKSLQAWSWTQFAIAFAMMLHLFNDIVDIGFSNAVLYGAFIFANIFSITTLMDRSVHAWWIQLIVSIGGLAIVLAQKDWFLINTVLPEGHLFIIGFWIISLIITTGFVYLEIKSEKSQELELA